MYGGTCNKPATPDSTTTNTDDRDQMMCQLGIAAPGPLLPKLQDPPRDSAAYPSDPNNPEGNWTDDLHDTFTRSGFGLWNNYLEDDPYLLGQYTPLDLLKMNDGTLVLTPEDWWTKKRPEMLHGLQDELYGFIPEQSQWPAISWVVETPTTGSQTVNGIVYTYQEKKITGVIDTSSYPALRNAPRIALTCRTPIDRIGMKTPVFIQYGFSFGPFVFPPLHFQYTAPHGYSACSYYPTQLQPDSGGANMSSYIIGLMNKGNWRKPSDWGALAAWAWGISRFVDYLATDPDFDATKTALEGHSRYGKATLVAVAYDDRILIGWPSSAGSLGTKPAKRHWGQDLENSGGTSEYHWMAGSFFKFMGQLEGSIYDGHYLPRKVELLTVDAQSAEAVVAPRPLFVTSGQRFTGDGWVDPRGTYLAATSASPVYEFLGMKGLINPDPLDAPDQTPRLDVAYVDGDLGYRHHKEGHTDTPDWPIFVEFASRYMNDNWPVVPAGQRFTLGAATVNVVGQVTASDPDAGDVLGNWQAKGGTGVGLFTIDRQTGLVNIANAAGIDFAATPRYSLIVTVSDGRLTSKDRVVTIALPVKMNVCHTNGKTLSISKVAVPDHLGHGDSIGFCR
jgi:hypothetical protein